MWLWAKSLLQHSCLILNLGEWLFLVFLLLLVSGLSHPLSSFCDGSQRRGVSADSREAPGGVLYLRPSPFCLFFILHLAQVELVGPLGLRPALSNKACVAHLFNSKHWHLLILYVPCLSSSWLIMSCEQSNIICLLELVCIYFAHIYSFGLFSFAQY